ncbi:CoA-dependent acyltransferase [Suillus brevipes Sb2]|nr:CoA-dependent acyltransferase [Suillus brevipes Sb2]
MAFRILPTCDPFAACSYIKDFWYESYLSHSDMVMLALNPFFVLDRVSSLIISSLGFIHDLRQGLLDPDAVRGRSLDMDQCSRLFGTTRIPTELAFAFGYSYILLDWFDALDEDHRPLLTEREVLCNLQAICMDANKIPITEVARHTGYRTAIGVLTTENRKTWFSLRHELAGDKTNAACLRLVDDALFVVCLDDAAQEGVGINFERTGIDGHTRVFLYAHITIMFAADFFTEGLMLLARSINPSAPTLFQASLSLRTKSYKRPKLTTNGNSPISCQSFSHTHDTKLMWTLTPSITGGIRYAETRLSDLICQNDCQVLEFKGYGKVFIASHGFSPDNATYEPAMTKAFLHGRTEAIRAVQPERVDFAKTFFSESVNCTRPASNTKECSQGLGPRPVILMASGRHRCALYFLHQRQVTGNIDTSPDDPVPNGSIQKNVLPSIFADPGWNLLSTSILSTSNCRNPVLRLFGFGPVAADGYGIGYIIKGNWISMHGYLLEVQRILIQLHRSANAPYTIYESGSDYEDAVAGYSFFDSGDIDLLGRRKRSPFANIGFAAVDLERLGEQISSATIARMVDAVRLYALVGVGLGLPQLV